jgi:membrane protein YqaA with SNARE-associated domain
MNIGLVTIAAFLLLLPGVGFIVGVNFADKNVREIVFRNTPAEIGYVVFISVVVHFLLASIWRGFSVAQIYVDYAGVTSTPARGALAIEKVHEAVLLSLGYCLISSILGSVAGFVLGRAVRSRAAREQAPGGRRLRDWAHRRWRALIQLFVKHRWMIDLLPTNAEVVHARVVLKDNISFVDKDKKYPVIIEGVVRDCFFDSNGTLLYIVFRTFKEVKVRPARAPYMDVLTEFVGAEGVDHLSIEGKNVAMARYYRSRPLPLATIEAANLDV